MAAATLIAGLGCIDEPAETDAGPNERDGGAEVGDAGSDAGPVCEGNCAPPPCPQHEWLGRPCCDADGNVVSEVACFEDAGPLCGSGEMSACEP
jgi:hypothetical protein